MVQTYAQDNGSVTANSSPWQPIETAPKDRAILVWAPGRDGLSPLHSVCIWHPDAGFCIDELREPKYWMHLPEPPKEDEEAAQGGIIIKDCTIVNSQNYITQCFDS